MRIFTIGFTKKTAEQFFSRLTHAQVKTIVDVRLNNVSQLAGFSKKDDLQYFAKSIANIDYLHEPCMAPEQAMLDEYKKKTHDWETYEHRFTSLIKERQIESRVTKEQIQDACLLCSEDKPHHCHRRLVAEYLKNVWGDVEIIHL